MKRYLVGYKRVAVWEDALIVDAESWEDACETAKEQVGDLRFDDLAPTDVDVQILSMEDVRVEAD